LREIASVCMTGCVRIATETARKENAGRHKNARVKNRTRLEFVAHIGLVRFFSRRAGDYKIGDTS